MRQRVDHDIILNMVWSCLINHLCTLDCKIERLWITKPETHFVFCSHDLPNLKCDFSYSVPCSGYSRYLERNALYNQNTFIGHFLSYQNYQLRLTELLWHVEVSAAEGKYGAFNMRRESKPEL